MKNSQRPWLVRYGFYIPLLMTGALSLFVLAVAAELDLLRADQFWQYSALLLVWNGIPATLGLLLHAFVASCRESTDSSQGRPAYKRERPARLVNIDDMGEGGFVGKVQTGMHFVALDNDEAKITFRDAAPDKPEISGFHHHSQARDLVTSDRR